jgi:hypothetical protein
MMKRHVYRSLFVAFAILAHFATAENERTFAAPGTSWQNLVTNDFRVFLEKVTAKDARFKWESATDQTASIKSNASVRNSTSGLEGTVLRQLRSYPVSLPGLTITDGKTVANNVSVLQDFRDLLTEKPNYVDLLLVDTINRVVFVCLSRHIISARKVCPDVKAQVQRLHGFALKPSKLAFALDGEPVRSAGAASSNSEAFVFPAFETGLRKQTARGRENEQELREFYRLFMKASGATCLNDALTKPRGSALLETKDFPALLMLMVISEQYIHVSLPLLAAYVEKCPDFSLDDDFSKIETVLNLSDADREQYGSYLAAATPGIEGEVRRLLDQVRLATLESYAGLTEAQQKLAFKPSKETLVEKALSDIESAKAQIKMLRSLSSEDSVSVEDIRAYLGKDLFMPEGGGRYQVGAIGQPATFVSPNGKVISIRR